MLILLYGALFHIICGIYATNTTNLGYCEIQKQEFCGSRPHLLCDPSYENITEKMSLRQKRYLMNQLMSGRDNASQLQWDDELEVISNKLSQHEDPNQYCMSSRNFIDVQSVVFKMFCSDHGLLCNITADPFGKHEGKIHNIGCGTKLVSHIDSNETHTILCLYNISNRLTSDEYINLSTGISDAIGILKINLIWLILAATAIIMTTI